MCVCAFCRGLHVRANANQRNVSGIFGFFVYTSFLSNFFQFTPIPGSAKKECPAILHIVIIIISPSSVSGKKVCLNCGYVFATKDTVKCGNVAFTSF